MNSAIIVAAGSGTRMGGDTPKQLLALAGRSVLAHTLRAFEDADSIQEVVLVVPPDAIDRFREEAESAGAEKVKAVVAGGRERQNSVALGLEAVSPDTDVVAIHDAVRPLILPEGIDAVVEAASSEGAAVLATPVTDTIKEVEDKIVRQTIDRSALWTVQTPQAFTLDLIRRAHQSAAAETHTSTDDTALVEQLGERVAVVPGRRDNLKITIPEDLNIAELILESRSGSELRTGIGYDVHRLVEGRSLVLGCVTIPHEAGLLGHSDADVLSHAIVDAVLGAVGAGDIGRLFPDTEAAWKDSPSRIFLEGASDRLKQLNATLVNVDAVIMAQRPKLSPHIADMEAAVAQALGVPADRVSIKATTTEELGFVGEGKGMAAQAVAVVKV